jgi:hypothetical protein
MESVTGEDQTSARGEPIAAKKNNLLAGDIGIDVLIILLVAPVYALLNRGGFFLVVPLLFYLLLELWTPLALHAALPRRFDRIRLAFLARFFLLLVMIAGAAVVPSLERIVSRLEISAEDPRSAEAYRRMHDGAVQVESALDFLSSGKNPYEERYDDTPLQYFAFSGIAIESNPAYEHFVYLPGLLVISFPFRQVLGSLDLPYDQRLIYLSSFILLVLLLPLMVESPTNKLSLLAAVGLNPALTGMVVKGMNDVVIVLFLVLLAMALAKRRLLLSALFLGLACTIKQSAWLFVPFYLLILCIMLPTKPSAREIARPLGVVSLVAIALIVPFFLWEPGAFILDVFAYPGGAVEVNYPIRGYNLGRLLVGSGIIASPLDPFPFWILQLAFGVPLLLMLLRYQRRRNSVGTMLLCGSMFMFGIGFLSRFFQDNYVGFATVMIILGMLLNMANERRWNPVAEHAEILLE